MAHENGNQGTENDLPDMFYAAKGNRCLCFWRLGVKSQ
jgi:hypothetical protein